MDEIILSKEIKGNLEVRQSISKAWLSSKIDDVYTPDQVDKLEKQHGKPIKGKKIIEFIKEDIENKDLLGYKPYKEILRKEGLI